jgi:hypothetical protein
MENISGADRVRNGEVSHGFKEKRNILHAITQRKATWFGHFLRGNCLLKHFIEEEIKGTERGKRRRKQELDDLKKKRRYCKLKEEEIDFTLQRTRLGRRYGPAIRPTTY